MNIQWRLLCLLFLCCSKAYGQVPNKMSFQAVMRDSTQKLIVNQNVSLKFSILADNANGQVVYSEMQNVQTNQNGIISLEIGGNVSFDQIAWSSGKFFIKTEADFQGGTNYEIIGTTEMLSIPYAFHANTADSLTGNVNELDPIFSKSIASSLSGSDTSYWNSKLDTFIEIQNLQDILSQGNSAMNQIKNLQNPTNDQDAVTKVYVDSLKKTIDGLIRFLKNSGLFNIEDVDGNNYSAIQIGSQFWFSENLKTTKLNDGTPLRLAVTEIDWLDTTTNYCWHQNNKNLYMNLYGAYYNWRAVNTNKLCPTGWHVATDSDWAILENYLGGRPVAGGKLKEVGTKNWDSPNTGATNETGFNAVPAGGRAEVDFFFYKADALWWTSTYDIGTASIIRYITYSGPEIEKDIAEHYYGYPVRCVMD